MDLLHSRQAIAALAHQKIDAQPGAYHHRLAEDQTQKVRGTPVLENQQLEQPGHQGGKPDLPRPLALSR